MQEEITRLQQRQKELDQLTTDPSLYRDRELHRSVMREHAHITEVLQLYRKYCHAQQQLQQTRELAEQEDDAGMRVLAQEEAGQLEKDVAEYEQKLRLLLTPPDPLDDKDVILEIRAGTGGDEASLFANDLYRMYARFCERQKWSLEILSSSISAAGGFKEVICSISGQSCFKALRYESGVHRVQRVPVTESAGRVHTSAVSVVVLPETGETEIDIGPEDIRIDVFRSSGPGGQSVNTTDSAVRITHLPTGIVVSCQDEKSQHKNRDKALRVLRARVFEQEQQRRQAERDSTRRTQIGTGDRSQRIRTYNFPQNRLTDHRITLTLYRLEQIMDGDLDEIITQMQLHQTSQAH